MGIENCVCVIFGGAQGVGKLISEQLLKKGAKVVISESDEDKLKGDAFLNQVYQNEIPEDQVIFVPYQRQNTESIDDVLQKAKAWGDVGVVCHVGGSGSPDPGEGRRLLEGHIERYVAGTYKAIRVMSRKNGGKGGLVLNICSMAGDRVDQLAAKYTTAEMGVVAAFIRSFSLFPHTADDGVRVNCICPSSSGGVGDGGMGRGWERRPSSQDFVLSRGRVSEPSVVKAFMKCVEDNTMNGSVLEVLPDDNIVQV